MTPKARIVAAVVAATLTFASSPVLWAQDASHKLTAMDEFQLQLPADPQLSPDGKRIAYVRRFADPMTDKRYSNLWIINTDGTDHRPLTTGNRSDVSPRWSPDGMRLTYLSDADGKQQIYIRWMDTGQTARITNLEQSPDAIAWRGNCSAKGIGTIHERQVLHSTKTAGFELAILRVATPKDFFTLRVDGRKCSSAAVKTYILLRLNKSCCPTPMFKMRPSLVSPTRNGERWALPTWWYEDKAGSLRKKSSTL